MKIIKVPTSLGSLGKNNGCGKAPDLILEELKKILLNENGRKLDFEIDEIKVSNNLDEINKNILAKKGDVFIGGDHSITYSSFKGSRCNAILIFDAHPDLEVYTKTITHEDYLRKLIDDNIVKKENVILVGIRNISENELKYLKENKIKYYTMKQIFEYGVEEICDIIMELVKDFDLYLSVDIDIVDPAYAPGTGCLEAGGLSSRELIYFLQRLKLLNIKRFDLVEVNPEIENKGTIKLAAKIIAELI